ncbi:hypothetical protein OS125_11510 [Corynebacterium sp. P7003]|uniref:Uncharacterized protein n=1 Tax=Corynebacterium pygosceleis TaxID=2800406 RepID=A0ABT3WUP8_9CORY|nr:hypothetical protein [Corynebacterium pygosceleis]MCX7445858.1 hypothetical protein [Corynebacterium pygosceleis]
MRTPRSRGELNIACRHILERLDAVRLTPSLTAGEKERVRLLMREVADIQKRGTGPRRWPTAADKAREAQHVNHS